MALSLVVVVFDCLDPRVVADFWAAALAYETRRAGDDYAWLIDPNGAQTGLFFQQVSERKTIKNRVHVDLNADDMDAEVERLIGLGARILRVYQEEGSTWTIMQDPEGNEFCIFPTG